MLRFSARNARQLASLLQKNNQTTLLSGARVNGARALSSSSSSSSSDKSKWTHPPFSHDDKIEMSGFKHHTLVKWSSISLVVLMPAGLALAPSQLCLPVDTLMGLIIPIHGFWGMEKIIHDYAPRPVQGALTWFWMAVTGATILGLARLNMQGKGMSNSLKELWREPSK